jgi:hypothetical protein
MVAVAERLYYSNPPMDPSTLVREGGARLHALALSQRNRWRIKLASSDFRSIVGLPWVV